MPQPIDFMRMIQQIRRRYAESLRPLERRWMLTGNEIDVLLFLANNPGYDTARDAVEMRGLSKSHVCKSVDALTKRGWLAGRAGQEGPAVRPPAPTPPPPSRRWRSAASPSGRFSARSTAASPTMSWRPWSGCCTSWNTI